MKTLVADAEEDMILNCVNAGCNDYITKPLDLAKIETKLAKLGFSKLPKTTSETHKLKCLPTRKLLKSRSGSQRTVFPGGDVIG